MGTIDLRPKPPPAPDPPVSEEERCPTISGPWIPDETGAKWCRCVYPVFGHPRHPDRPEARFHLMARWPEGNERMAQIEKGTE
jgi:hypothetical protein